MIDNNLTVHATVDGELTFAVLSGQKPATYPTELDPETGVARYTGELQNRHVPLENGRNVVGNLSLDLQGFILKNHQTTVSNFYDENEIFNNYLYLKNNCC